MKRIALLLSFVSLVPVSVNASALAQNACEEDKTSPVCVAYIEGMVKGYMASHQVQSNDTPNLKEGFASRAFANRVGLHRLNLTSTPTACVPEDFDNRVLIKHLSKLDAAKDLAMELGDYLAMNFPCTEKRN